MLNRICVMGRLVRDPELKATQSNIPVANFSVAVDRDIKGKDGTRECDYFNIVAWRQQATFVCNYFVKGRMIYIDGRLQTRSYTDKDGSEKTVYEIVAGSVGPCGDRLAETAPDDTRRRDPSAFSAPAQEDEYDDNKVPF